MPSFFSGFDFSNFWNFVNKEIVMNKRTAILLIAFLVCMYPSAAFAEPTVTGPSGLIVIPTADVTPIDHAWIGLNFIDLDTLILPDLGTEGGTMWTGTLTGGLSDNFEVGLGFSLQEESDNGILFNAKFLVVPEDEEAWYPAVALGGKFTKVAGKNDTSIYVVGSKFFWLEDKGYYGGSVHLGLDYSKPVDDWELYVFAGADLSFTEELIAIIEWHQDDDAFGHGFTYGMRYYFNDTTTGQAGFIDGDLTIGGSYIF